MPLWRWAPGATAVVVVEVLWLPAFSRSSFTTTSFSSSSLLALRCLGPPPPSHRAPLPSTTSVLRGVHVSAAVGPDDGTRKEEGGSCCLPSGRPEREGLGKEVARFPEPCGAVAACSRARRRRSEARRGEAATCRFCSAAPKLPPMMLLLLLSGRRNRQWDRSPSSARTSHAAGTRSPHLRMGGSAWRQKARTRPPVARTGNSGLLLSALWAM